LHTLLVTPWLAAGAGIVAAAALAVDVPHAVLSYGPANPGQSCQVSGCNSAAPNVESSAKARVTPPAVRSAQRPATQARQHKITEVVSYQVVQRSRQSFVAVITLPSQSRHGPWSLQFSLPGAHVDRVLGAKWQPSAQGNGGIASDDGSNTHGSRQSGRHASGGASFTIYATGRPGMPTGCMFNGSSCHFG
jgi:hypothetical protein